MYNLKLPIDTFGKRVLYHLYQAKEIKTVITDESPLRFIPDTKGIFIDTNTVTDPTRQLLKTNNELEGIE